MSDMGGTVDLEEMITRGSDVFVAATSPISALDSTFSNSYPSQSGFTVECGKDKQSKFKLPKNLGERIFAGAALLLASPFIGLYEIYYGIKYGESCVFRQERIGQDEKIFTMYKFKSTKPGVLKRFHGSDVIQDDLTPEGRILRKFSADEFLNLFNVLLGDMTIFPKGNGEYRALCADGVYGEEKSPCECVRHLLRRDHGQYLAKPSILNANTLTYKTSGVPDEELPDHEFCFFAYSDLERKDFRYKLDCLYMLLDVVVNRRNK